MPRSPYTAAALFALESAKARGVLTVSNPDGSSTTYRSLDEIDRIIVDMRRHLKENSGYGRTYAQHSKGFGA